MLLLHFLFFLLASIDAAEVRGRADGRRLAPIFRPNARLVPNTYIVRLHEGYTLSRHFTHCRLDLSKAIRGFEELSALHSYRAQLDDYTVNHLIRTDPGVEYIEQDHYIHGPKSTKHAVYDNSNLLSSSYSKRWLERWIKKPYWHLQMITAGKKEKIGTGRVDPVRILQTAGRGVNAYVLDTGVRITHKVFQGRASNFKNRTTTPYCEGSNSGMSDSSNNSHGTAVASLLGGGAGGVSVSFANIINVKIFCVEEAANWMIARAIADVTDEHRTFVRNRPAWFKGSVINLSFGTDYSPTAERVMEEANRAGIAIVAAAGNTEPPYPPGLASRNFPCNSPSTICVTSCNHTYQKSSWADYGSAVDIIAPGEKVPSAHAGSDTLAASSSGTSLASPIVGSVLAQFIAYERLMTDSNTVRQRLFDNSLRNAIEGLAKSGAKALRTPNSLVNIPTNLNHSRGRPYIGAPG